MPATVRCRRIPLLKLPTVWDHLAKSTSEWSPAVPRQAEALKTNVATALRREPAKFTVCSLTI
jgi:hypothetical protein